MPCYVLVCILPTGCTFTPYQPKQRRSVISSTTLAVSGPASMVAGQCAGPFKVSAPEAASLVGISTSQVFSDPECLAPVRDRSHERIYHSVSLPTETGTVDLYLRTTLAGELQLLVEPTGGGKTVSTTVVVLPGPPDRVIVSGPATANAGECAGPFHATSFDFFGNLAPVPSEIQLAMPQLTGAYLDGGCVTGSAPRIPSGRATSLFYLKEQTSGTRELKPNAKGFRVAEPHIVTLKQGVSALLFGPPEIEAGHCGTFRLNLVDESLAPATLPDTTKVTLTGMENFIPCDGASLSAIPAGTSSVEFKLRAYISGSYVAVAKPEGLSESRSPLTVRAGPLARLALTGPTAYVAGECTGPFLVTQLDDYQNGVTARPPGSPATLAGIQSATVHSDSLCRDSGNPVVGAGNSGTVFYLRDEKAESLSLSITVDGKTSNSISINGNAAAPTVLAIDGPSPIVGETCAGPYLVEARDAFGNEAYFEKGAPVSFQGLEGGRVFPFAGCNGTEIAFAVGSSETAFFLSYPHAKALSLTVAADDATGKMPIVVNAPIYPPAKFEIDRPAADFGTLSPGYSPASVTFTVKNGGVLPLTLGNFSLPTGFSLTQALSKNGLAAGETATFAVAFSSTTTSYTPYVGKLSFTTTDPDKPLVQIPLSATLYPPALFEVDRATADFGDLAPGYTVAPVTFTVRNGGMLPLTLGTFAVSSGFSLTQALSKNGLAAGETATFAVAFSSTVPSEIPYAGVISFTTTDPDRPLIQLRLSATLYPPPKFEIDRWLADFGQVQPGDTINPVSFTVRNTGFKPLTLGAMSLPDGFSLSQSLTKNNLKGGESATFAVILSTKTPSETPYTGFASFSTNDPGQPVVNLPLSGTLSASGFPDRRWDSDGVARFSTGTVEWGTGVVRVGRGAVILGTTKLGGVTGFALARFLEDGSLDPSFGTNGSVHFTFPGATESRAGRLALQPDGKLVAVGYAVIDGWRDTAVARLNGNGTLDTSFDGDGRIIVNNDEDDDEATDVVIQKDGSIVVAGYEDHTNEDSEFSVIRLTKSGAVDTSFGLITIDRATLSWIQGYRVALQKDGKIVCTGRAVDPATGRQVMVLQRLKSNGSEDTIGGQKVIYESFTGNGAAFGLTLDDGPSGAQKFILVGGGNGDFAVVRLNANGTKDVSFSGDGIFNYAFGAGDDAARDVFLQSDGKILVVGNDTTSDKRVAMLRLTTDGTLDPTFGSGGVFSTTLGGISPTARALYADGEMSFVVGDGANAFFLAKLFP